MAVPEQIPVVNYVADGIVKKFDVPFEYDQQSDLHVYVDGAEPTIDKYYFDGNAFNFYIAPTIGQNVKIKRITPKERDTDYNLHTNTVRPKALNTDFDRLWYVLQEVFSDVGGLSQAVQDEIIARIQGDEDLLNQLTAEISARMLGDEAVTEDLKNYVNQVVGAIIGDPSFAGIDAKNVNDASGETQQQVNYNGGSKWHSRVGGYKLNERVVLTNGDIVKSTINGNTNDPNVNMTGWVKTNSASQIFDESGKTQQELTDFEPNLLNQTDAMPDTDITSVLQRFVKSADDTRKPTVTIPQNSINYELSAPIVIQEPTAIVGDKGATYDRGLGKQGWFLLKDGMTHAFDFGNYRTYQAGVYDPDNNISPNPADYWTFKNLGIKPDAGVTPRTQDGIRLTTQTNGPDRALQVDNASLRRLDRAIFIEKQLDAARIVSIASLNVENSVIADSNYGIYCDGRSFQTAIENNQIEQNYQASIWGRFDGPLRVINNIIEGAAQPKGIVIRNTEGSFNSSVQAVIESQYFEALQDSCIDAELRNGSALWLRGNRNYGTATTDYALIKQGSRTNLYNEEQERVTLEDGVRLNINSELTRNLDYSFYFKPTVTNWSATTVVHDIHRLQYANSDYVNISASVARSIAKIGNQLCYAIDTQTAFGSINMSVAVGDVLELSILVYADTLGTLNCNLSDESNLVASVPIANSSKKWVVATVIVRATAASTQFYLTPQINTATATGVKIAGFTIRNLGVGALGNKYLARPVEPIVNTIAGKHAQKYAYAGETLAANSSRSFDLVLSQDGNIGNIVQVALSTYTEGIAVSGIIRSGGVLRVTISNNKSESIVIPASTLLAIVL